MEKREGERHLGRDVEVKRTPVWSKPTAQDVIVVCATWALLLVCMALAQAMNYRLGFAVWPLGEDRNWIDILQNNKGTAAARAFWEVNDRNPLAPWWYIALRPIILQFDAGLLIIRDVVGLLLALAVYFFLFVMTHARMFALGIACVVAAFLGNGYFDQIYWTMQLALAFSLMSVTLYSLYVERHSTDTRLYAAAIATWFVALGTYSVQTGAILAIALLAFIAPAPTVLARIRRVITDSLPFAFIFVLFWLEWQTTARRAYAGQPHFHEAILSVGQAFWHFDYRMFFNTFVYADLSYQLFYAAVAAVLGIFVFYMLERHDADPWLSWQSLFKAVSTVGCLMLPVVAIEAIGHGIPGEGWRKVYQFTIPLLYLSIAATLLQGLSFKAAAVSWRVTAGLLTAAAAVVTLGTNHIQVEITRNEKLLRSELIRLAEENRKEGIPPPYQFLVRREPNFLWYSYDLLSPIYARTWMFPLPTFFRFMPGAQVSDPQLFLRYTEDGVQNAALDGRVISNDHIFLVSAAKDGVRRLCSVGPGDVSSPAVEWRRTTPFVSNGRECSAGPSISK